MDDRLRLLQYLYEDTDDPALVRRLADDEALYREFEQLRATKGQLDRLPSHRPDPGVVDQVVETARTAAQESASSPEHAQEDRPARSPTRRTWTRRLQTASATLALVLLVGLAWWQVQDLSGASTALRTSEQAPETAQRTSSGAAASGHRAVLPAWDDQDALVRIHRRLEQLQSRSRTDAWGTTVQPVSQMQP